MMRYSVGLRVFCLFWIDFCLFSAFYALNIGKNLRDEYNHILFDHAKQSVTDSLKTVFKRATQKNTRSNWRFNCQ